VIGGGSIGNPGPSWHVMGTGDYNGAGQNDILFQNSSGAVTVWEVSGTSVIGSDSLANPAHLSHLTRVVPRRSGR
jgi:hypothetical protein